MADKLGILGFGKLGTVLGQLAVRAGYDVYIAGSGTTDKIALTADILLPQAHLMLAKELLGQVDVVILAFPLGKYRTLDPLLFKNKIVIDAMNYWWETDGRHPEFQDPVLSTSEMVQAHLNQSHVVKAFNHMGYHDLLDYADQSDPKKAIAVAADDVPSRAVVAEIVKRLGFQPVILDSLAEGIKLEPGTNVFGADFNRAELLNAIDHYFETDFGKKILQSSKKHSF
ncbi:MAG: NAD(P)-binding domain-containing protein [Oenococcus sp.]|uniref:NADPH-dependent F420 reductase n=1 Tax=Oenococcus TaxID=46254 RepID=UPI0021E8CE4E|nr:NAD(P)-binding domain-containing protein [Oenococcus kitaharae]MCV3295524.1 NAD(P)-binding domain-containing protein [Oenococcus kitaharae]